MLAEIPASFNKGGYYIVGSGEVLSPAPAPPPLMPPSPPPAPPRLPSPSPDVAAGPAVAASPPALPGPLQATSSGSSSLSAGAVAGIAVGATCLLLALVGTATVWRRRRRQQLPAPKDSKGSLSGSAQPSAVLKLSASEDGSKSLPSTLGGLLGGIPQKRCQACPRQHGTCSRPSCDGLVAFV